MFEYYREPLFFKWTLESNANMKLLGVLYLASRETSHCTNLFLLIDRLLESVRLFEAAVRLNHFR